MRPFNKTIIKQGKITETKHGLGVPNTHHKILTPHSTGQQGTKDEKNIYSANQLYKLANDLGFNTPKEAPAQLYREKTTELWQRIGCIHVKG